MRGLRARARHALDWRFRGVIARVEAVLARLDALEARLDTVAAAVDGLAARVDAELSPALRAVVTEEAENRRRLHAARAAPEHDAAFADPEPLVSIVIPTHDRPQLLVERAIASALAQTHPRIEVVVAGDQAPPHVEAAVRALGDERIHFANTTHRVVPSDPERHWLAASTLPRNLGAQLARGAWIVELDDDDALRPDAVERLLRVARAERAEVVLARFEAHLPDGRTRLLGGFPPRYGDFGWQGAIAHAGLRFFERELFAVAYGVAGDFFKIDRMLRAGVRVAFLPAVTCDYFPGRPLEADAPGG
jgi:hypothetical protein